MGMRKTRTDRMERLAVLSILLGIGIIGVGVLVFTPESKLGGLLFAIGFAWTFGSALLVSLIVIVRKAFTARRDDWAKFLPVFGGGLLLIGTVILTLVAVMRLGEAIDRGLAGSCLIWGVLVLPGGLILTLAGHGLLTMEKAAPVRYVPSASGCAMLLGVGLVLYGLGGIVCSIVLAVRQA